jgi:hypothetical protein
MEANNMSSPRGTAVVTGASGGIGALYAYGLAERGYDLVLTGRQPAALDATAASTRKAGVNVETIIADLAKPEDLARVEARIANDQAISALINNAGTATFAPLAKLSLAALDDTIAVNITALTRLTRAVLPGLTARSKGAIVNFASVLAFHPWPEFGVYDASKAYVVSFSQALQGEMADKGILVQVVVPPAVDTAFWTAAGIPVSNLPAGAVMTPQDLVGAALKGLDRGEAWVFPSLPDVGAWEDFQKARQTLVGGLMRGQPAPRYAP